MNPVEAAAEGKQPFSGCCGKCRNEGYYFVDEIEKSHYVICVQCGNETLETWCPKCGVGFTKDVGPDKRPRTWICECGAEYKLPVNFYKTPVTLFNAKDVPDSPRSSSGPTSRSRILLADLRMLFADLFSIRFTITLVSGLLFLALNYFLRNSAQDYYHSLFRQDLLMLPIFCLIFSGWAVFSELKYIHWFGKLMVKLAKFSWIIVMAVLWYCEVGLVYDWFSQPKQVSGSVKMVSVEEVYYRPGHESYLMRAPYSNVRIRFEDSKKLWTLRGPNNVDWYRQLEGRNVVIEYSPMLEKIASVKVIGGQ